MGRIEHDGWRKTGRRWRKRTRRNGGPVDTQWKADPQVDKATDNLICRIDGG